MDKQQKQQFHYEHEGEEYVHNQLLDYYHVGSDTSQRLETNEEGHSANMKA
ncbi:hypothetical protein [Bacillus sp. FJAT-44742]|uniref:hypothetical protein n=1 Tax=Bacillus sp. FJAT-44742 TaxID=2014005 RepID=UPI0012FF0A0F|nr:hypothetical protein [Bacillus sp. FJAT-44742]